MAFNKLLDSLNCSLGQFYNLSPVLTCSKNSKVNEVIRLMNENHVGSVVIVEHQKPIGIFTERDVLKKVVGSQAVDINTTPVEYLMTRDPITVTLETSFSQIMGAMRLGKFRHLIIVNQKGQLIGVISIKDVLSRVVDLVNDIKE
jgi:CBS domain-containing protein